MAKRPKPHNELPVISLRLRHAREDAGLTQGELADRTGMTQTGIASIESGESLRPRKLLEIARAVGKTPEFLLGQDDRPRRALEVISGASARRIGAVGEMPVRGEVAAGVWRDVEATDESPFAPLHVAPNPLYPADAQYGLVVRGTSINRIARDGDIVVCLDLALTGIRPVHNDLVVFERRRFQEGIREVTVKRLRRESGRMELWPESDDPRFQMPISLSGDTLGDDSEGRVIAVVDWIFVPVRSRGR